MDLGAVFFDMDGTLANTLADIAYAVNRGLTDFGFPTHEVDAFRQFVGDGLALTIERALPDGYAHKTEAIAEPIRRYYARHLGEHSTLYAGIPRMLDQLSERGISLGIISNKPDWALQDMVARYFSRWTFVLVAGQKPDVPPKPDPTVALQAAGIAGVDPARCVFVGDSGVDMKTAANAGMVPVGVLWGYRGREELQESGALLLVEEPAELLALIDLGVRE